MNTIPGKVRKFVRDSFLSLKYVARSRPHVIEKPKTDFESLEADFEALDSLCYFLLGSMFDAVLDIIYENDVPQSKVNPLISFALAVLVFQIPTLMIFVEILGAVPGRGTLYSYAYSGLWEVFAFFCGWIWIGAAAGRVATTLHYFTSSLLQIFKNFIDLDIAVILGGLLIYMFLPFASKKLSVSFNSTGAAVRVILPLFLISYVDTENWIRTVGPVNVSDVIMSTLNFFQLYYSLPMVSSMLQKATRTRMLIRKLILIMVCVVLFHACFFLVLVGYVPYDQTPKPWVFNLIGRFRPMPYLLIFICCSYICKFCGVMATMHGASALLYQMSSDGIIFSFISSSDTLRIVFFLLSSMSIFLCGYEYSREIFAVLSSIGMILAAISLLFLKSLGQPGFYERISKPMVKKEKKKKKEIFMEAIVKSMLVILLVGCLMGCFVVRILLDNSFDPYSVNFFVFMIALCFIGMALLILTVGRKFRSVHASIHCPLGPYIPVFVMFISCTNFALKIEVVTLGVILWVILGLLLYFLFGLKNVTIKMTSETKEDQENKPNNFQEENECEDYRIFEILKSRVEICESKIAKRKRDLELIGAPPLCAKRDLNFESKFPERNVKPIKHNRGT